MGLQFGVFDHIEPTPGVDLNSLYKHRLDQIEMFDKAGFYGYHLAEHHTPAVHSLAPSQNVFLSAASQRTSHIKLCPTIYVLPLHHPLRLIEEICMLDHLSDGRLEIGVGRGGVLEAYFWGSDSDVEDNFNKYKETLDIVRLGLVSEHLTYKGQFYEFDELPMRLRPYQSPRPPMWYMRNTETAAMEGMNCIVVGNLADFGPNVSRFRTIWEEAHGDSKSELPKIGLVNHIVIANTEQEALDAAGPAWDEYIWNLSAPRRIEAENRGLTQFLKELNPRPEGLPDRTADSERYVSTVRQDKYLEKEPGNIGESNRSAGFRAVAGTPEMICEYLDAYLETGANYFVCAFHFGNMPDEVAQRSIRLFVDKVMPKYV
ncbi:MAG: LLM class flavin-dependent oxidoreductase [Dehalococcoidia bacterium]|tara:strand:+ start:200 stop:1318 length:1119 start_codon:yes stop_codon:yes gene_type:complete